MLSRLFFVLAYVVGCLTLNDSILALAIDTLMKWRIFLETLVIGFTIMVLEAGDVDSTLRFLIIAGKALFIPLSMMSCIFLLHAWPVRIDDWNISYATEVSEILFFAFIWKVHFKIGGPFYWLGRVIAAVFWPWGLK